MPATLNGSGIVFGDGTSQTTTMTPTLSAGTFYQTNEASSVSHNTTNWKAGNSIVMSISGTVRVRVAGGSGRLDDSKGGSSFCQAYYDVYKNGVNLGRVVNNNGNSQIQFGTIDVSVTRGDTIQLYIYVQYASYNASGVAYPGVSINTPIKLANRLEVL
jgi:hypothetical protein